MDNKLYYIPSNANSIPSGIVTSTARKGDKWFNLVNPGDVVQLVETGSERRLGWAVVVQKDLGNYADVLENADHNHTGYFNSGERRTASFARLRLANELRDAYGDLNPSDTFTMLFILPLNGGTIVEGLDRTMRITTAALRNSHERAAGLEQTNNLLMGIIAQKEHEKQARHDEIAGEVLALVDGASIAANSTDAEPSAVERTTRVGDIEMVTRIEF